MVKYRDNEIWIYRGFHKDVVKIEDIVSIESSMDEIKITTRDHEVHSFKMHMMTSISKLYDAISARNGEIAFKYDSGVENPTYIEKEKIKDYCDSVEPTLLAELEKYQDQITKWNAHLSGEIVLEEKFNNAYFQVSVEIDGAQAQYGKGFSKEEMDCIWAVGLVVSEWITPDPEDATQIVNEKYMEEFTDLMTQHLAVIKKYGMVVKK